MSINIEDNDEYAPKTGHWDIKEAEHNLANIRKHVSNLRELLERAIHQGNSQDKEYYEKELNHSLREEHGIQTEIDIHLKHGIIQNVYDKKINNARNSLANTSKTNFLELFKHKKALTVAEGEKRAHLLNLHREKNEFHRDAEANGYKMKTNIHSLFR